MSYTPDLKKVAISIKTFLRDENLFEAVAGIRQTMPEAQIVITDDGDPSPMKNRLYENLVASGHKVICLPFDSGFGKKSNEAARACSRPYLLIGSDDFDFRPLYVRQGVEKLVAVLDGGTIDIASGRVNGNRYEGHLEDQGHRIVERYIELNDQQEVNGVAYHRCDLTVNYSLIEASILGPGASQVRWDDDVKIGGGEHGAFFVDVKRAGYKVAWVPGVDIAEQQGKQIDRRYSSYRCRASQPERPCFVKRGIREYVCFGGSVERSS